MVGVVGLVGVVVVVLLANLVTTFNLTPYPHSLVMQLSTCTVNNCTKLENLAPARIRE